MHFDEPASLLQTENNFCFFNVLNKWLESFVFPSSTIDSFISLNSSNRKNSQLLINKAICFCLSEPIKVLNYKKSWPVIFFLKHFSLIDTIWGVIDLRKRIWSNSVACCILPHANAKCPTLAFLYNYCAKSQIKPTIVCFFRYAVSCLADMSKILRTKIVNGVVSSIQKVGNFK